MLGSFTEQKSSASMLDFAMLGSFTEQKSSASMLDFPATYEFFSVIPIYLQSVPVH
jgi:hypothetical protein